MKKHFILLLVAFLIFGATANAQIKFGVKGGINMTELSLKNLSDNFKTSNRTGFVLGPTVDFRLPILGLGVDASALITTQKTRVTHQNNGKDFKQWGVDIPVNLKYNIGFSSLIGMYLAAGPNFFFDFSKSTKFEGQKYKSEDMRVGLNIGAGLTLFSHFQVGAAYNIPMSKAAKSNIDNASYKTKSWQTTFTYFF